MLHSETVSRKEKKWRSCKASSPEESALGKHFKDIFGGLLFSPNRAHYCIMEIVRNSALSFVEWKGKWNRVATLDVKVSHRILLGVCFDFSGQCQISLSGWTPGQDSGHRVQPHFVLCNLTGSLFLFSPRLGWGQKARFGRLGPEHRSGYRARTAARPHLQGAEHAGMAGEERKSQIPHRQSELQQWESHLKAGLFRFPNCKIMTWI